MAIWSFWLCVEVRCPLKRSVWLRGRLVGDSLGPAGQLVGFAFMGRWVVGLQCGMLYWLFKNGVVG